MLSNGSLLSNRYVIKNRLGTGLAGHTYLATDLFVTDSVCAIKELAPEHEKSSLSYQHIRRKFQEEARCLRVLEGYNKQIPTLLDEFSANDTLYIVQEYIEGETLQSLIDREIMNQSKVRDLLVSLLKVVAYVHSKDILHRDIKPTNIILRAGTDTPVLIDFGSVKDLDITQVGTSVDISELTFMSKGYTAPEQLLGEAVPASDIYSLGKTAVHLLSRRHPKSLSDAIWRDQVKGLLPEFGEVIDKAISPYLAQRYKHPVDMLDALEKLVFAENREKIHIEISHSLTVVRRKPRPFPSVSRKCDGCEFVLTQENEFCPNCAAFNPLKLDRKSFLLHCGSAEQYFDEIVHPTLSRENQILLDLGARHRQKPNYRLRREARYLEYWLDEELEKQLWRFINKHHNKTLLHWIFLNKTKIAIFAFVPLVILWGILVLYVGTTFDLTPTVYWVLPIIALPLLTLFVFWSGTDYYRVMSVRNLYQRQCDLEDVRERELNSIAIKKSKLQKELTERGKVEKRHKRALKETERYIDNRIIDITKWIGELKSLLADINDERLIDNHLRQQHAVRLKATVQNAGQIQKQYQSKKIEVGLLRTNNFLQSKGNVAQMNHDLRTRIKKDLKEMIGSCNQMSNNLQEAEVASLARILEIGKIASKLLQYLIAHDIELALPGRTSDRSRSASEFSESLALLNAYVSIDDFTSELIKLETEYEGVRGGITGKPRFVS